MILPRLTALALCLGTAAYPGDASARDCAPSIRIDDTTSLAFGTIAVPRGGGGVVLLSASGPIATVGRLSTGSDSHPGVIRLCGPANAEFSLVITKAGTATGMPRGGMRGDVLGELELRAIVGSVRSAGADEWLGRLGGHGVAEIQVGGSIRLFSIRPGETLSLPVNVTVRER